MLDIIWGRINVPESLKPIVIMDSRWYYLEHMKASWFDDPFIKEILLEVDRATVVCQNALLSDKDEGFSTASISTGSKTLCCIYFDREHIFYGSQLGDNCLPYLVRMAANRDITIVLEHYADFTEDDINKGLIRCNGIVVDQDGYDDAFSEWSASTQEEDYDEKFFHCGL